MKFNIETRAFINAVDKASKGIAKNPYLSILECLKADLTDNECKLTSFNLEQYVITKVDTFGECEDGSFILPDTKQLLKAAKYFSAPTINIEVTDDKIIIKCGTKKIEQVNRFEVKDYPELPKITIKNTYTYTAKKLSERFDAVKYAVSKEDSKPILMGIHFNGGDMVALDGYRLAINTDESLNVEHPITVPLNGVKLAAMLLSGDVKINTSDKYITFENCDTVVGSRIFEGEYVDYKQFIPNNYESAFSVNTKDFVGELKYLKEFIESKDNVVGWHNGDLETVSPSGKYKTSVDMNGNDVDFVMFFNCQYMLDALSQFEGKIEYKIEHNLKPILLDDKMGNRALVLPINPRRVEGYFTELAS